MGARIKNLICLQKGNLNRKNRVTHTFNLIYLIEIARVKNLICL
jgi:hypothetical protein